VRFSAPVQIGPGAHPASCTMGTGSFPGVKSGRDVMMTPHPLLVPRSRKSRAIPLLPLWAIQPVQSLSAYTRVHFTFTFSQAIRPVRALKEVISKTCSNMWQVILNDTDCMKGFHFQLDVLHNTCFRVKYKHIRNSCQCYSKEIITIITHMFCMKKEVLI